MQSNIPKNQGDRWFDVINTLVFTVLLLIILYPLYYILIASVSNPDLVYAGKVWLWPVEFTTEGFQRLFRTERIWLGYRNTVVYTVVGTVINVVLTIMGGYALSRRDMPGGNVMMIGIVMTMFFGGGLIPTYMIVRAMGMLNTMWAVIIPTAVHAYHIIVVRTFYRMTIPDELLEAAKMDGCKDIRFFLHIAIPLSLPIIAVMALFNAVGHWNQYFLALIYLRDSNLHTLQMVLREILILEQATDIALDRIEEQQYMQRLSDLIRYGSIIVSSLPMLLLYPFLQKYFVQGMMIGSVKG